MATTTEQLAERQQIAQLVRAAQAGDREAFGELYRRYHQYVLTLAMRKLGNQAEAQELAQEVFIQALLKIEQLRTPECFGGWLRSITHRMSINRIVRKGPFVSTEPEAIEGSCMDTETPLVQALASERRAQVRAGLSRLRDLDRETLMAFYVDQQSLREMSDQFDAPLGTIKRRLHVARKRLSEQVEELAAV